MILNTYGQANILCPNLVVEEGSFSKLGIGKFKSVDNDNYCQNQEELALFFNARFVGYSKD